eukprot:3175562-Heterocapsa_arctica.AAC.1
MPGTTPLLFSGWPSATQMPHPDLRSLGSPGCAALPPVNAFTSPSTSPVGGLIRPGGFPNVDHLREPSDPEVLPQWRDLPCDLVS